MDQPSLFPSALRYSAAEPLTTPDAGEASDGCGRAVCAEKSCQRAFRPYRKEQRFCSEACRNREWIASHPRATEPEKSAEAKASRDRGMASAARHYRDDLGTARRVALEVIGRRGAGTVSHVREECERRGIKLDWALNWTGSLFHGSPWFEATGRRETSFHPSANARKVNEYRLSYEGKAALGDLT